MRNIKFFFISIFLFLTTFSVYANAQKLWHGFKCKEFNFEGRNGAIVEPKNPRKDGAWIFKPAFWGAFPNFDIEMLNRGYRFVFCNFTHDYANPNAIEAGGRFVDFIVREYKLSDKVSLEGMSRGGAYVLRFADNFPEKVAAVYVDVPVCDFSIWPGQASAKLRAEYFAKHNKADDNKFESSPIYSYKNIIKYGIPVWSICGDADKTVPIEKHFYVYRELLDDAGGISMLIVKNGCGHHPHGLKDPTPSADFIDRRQPSYMAKQHINLRENMGASLRKFKTTRKGKVGFVGNSTSEANVWQNAVKDDLKRRFPFTQFEFVETEDEASSIDLLFINAISGDVLLKDVEGKIRNVLSINPSCDVVLLYSLNNRDINLMQNDKLTSAIENGEKIAKHYKIVSINLIKEIAQRAEDREIDLSGHAGTASSLLLDKFCAAAVSNMLDVAQVRNGNSLPKIPYQIPEKSIND